MHLVEAGLRCLVEVGRKHPVEVSMKARVTGE
jgi:hypothetical protein